MTRFVYLHGFNSGYDPEHPKINILSELGVVSGITYNTYGTYDQILCELRSKIEYSDDLVLIGTSLGGYWAAKLASVLKVPSVIINPCYDPRKLLMNYEGVMLENYKTGKSDWLSTIAVHSYDGRDLNSDTDESYYKPLVLLDAGDEIISYRENQEALVGFPMKTFKGGSHIFDHMEQSLDEIKSYIRNCNLVQNID